MQRVERRRGRAGQRQRLRRLARTKGLCERCLGLNRWQGRGLGRTTIATIVNHIEPLTFGGSDDDDNTENLCGPCDKIVTAEQFKHVDVASSRGVDRNGRPTSRDHPWNAAEGGGGRKSTPPRGGHRAVGAYAPRCVPD